MDETLIQAKSILERARQVTDADERRAFLDQACANNSELRDYVEAQLTTLSEGSVLVDQGISPPDQQSNSLATQGEEVGSRIGPYKLLTQIGEGGMGAVWMAMQTEPVKRLVALKVIKAGMDSAHVLSRFEAERQVLALMDHPNIARVFDAGSVGQAFQPDSSGQAGKPDLHSGRPYFVMELVNGTAITRYCDQKQLTIRERLELFVSVCQAVQHAHQKGIIHRDLKPSNVLVALYDGKPAPKIIDFGIAKATSPTLDSRGAFTEVGQIVGTPEYMAPEQADVNNMDIDTRADVYSLGVLLYELLTGTPPFPSNELRQLSFTDILRTIREVEPPKPSTKLSSSPDLAALASQRKLEPRRLTRLVQGDLDWIVMKCLEKERSRRYETANNLALDVQRYLADEAVLAGPPSATYRLRKFVRRYKGAVLAATLLLLTLLGGIAGTSLGLLEARRQRDAAEDSAAKARQAEAEIRAVLTFFQDKVLAAARPREQEGGLGVDASIQAAIVAAEPKIAAAFQDQPRVEAEIRHALGLTYLYLGQAKQAIRQYERVVELRKTDLGPDHPDTLASMNNLAWAYQDDGRLKDAQTVAEETLARRKAVLGVDHPATLESMQKLALVYHESGHGKEALPLYQQTLELLTSKLGLNHPQTLVTMNSLGLLYKQLGRLKEALPLYQEALTRRRDTLGPNHPDTLQSMNNLAMAYKADGRPQEAVPLLRESWERKKATLGPNHRETVTTMNNLAGAYYETGRLKDALPLFEEALKRRQTDLGPNHRLTLVSMSDLVAAYKDSGRFAEAVKLGEETLKRRQATLGKENLETLTSMNNLALAYKAAGHLQDAAALFAQTLKLQIAQRGSDHPYSIITMNSLAQTYRDMGRLDDALPLAESATAKARTRFGPDKPMTLRFLDNLANIYDRRGQHDKAEPLWREIIALLQKTRPDDWMIFHSQSLLGGCLLAQKQYADAEPLLLQGYQGMKERQAKIPPQSKGRLAEAIERLVQLYEAMEKKDQADKWRKELEQSRKSANR